MNLDFETACAADLKKVGSYNYTNHPSFRVTTLVYWLAGQPGPKQWSGFHHPLLNIHGTQTAPDDLVEAIQNGEEIVGWNVSFERYCLAWMAKRDPRLANIPLEQYRCTMQQAAIVGLPLGLANCGDAVRCETTKDSDGKTVMLQTAKPRNAAKARKEDLEYRPKKGDSELTWYLRHTDRDKFAILDSYCEIDVRSESDLGRAIPDMTPGERKLAVIDAKINFRGLPVDMPSVERALELTSYIKEDGDRRLAELTDGEVPSATALPKLKEWLVGQGFPMTKVNKETIPEMLLRDDLPENVRKVLELRLEGGAASLKKLLTMNQLCCDDGTLKDQFQYSGAHTGRWSGRGVQPQNFFKGWGAPEKDENGNEYSPDAFLDGTPEQVTFFRLLNQDKPIAEIADDLRAEFGDLVAACKGALRGFIKAQPGYKFWVCDFAGIENRVVAWLSDEELMLDAFRNNEDLYKITAGGIYGVPVVEVTKEQRQLGKVCVLAAQFGQGPTGFKNTCRSPWGIEIDLKDARRTIKGYRQTYSRLKEFWYELYRACMSTVNSGNTHVVGKLRTEYDGESLQIVLPTGRRLHYWRPVVRQELAPWSWTEIALKFDPTEEQIEEWGIQPLDRRDKQNRPLYKLRDCDSAFREEVSTTQYDQGEYHEKYHFQLYHEQTGKGGKWKKITYKNSVAQVNDHDHGTWHGTLVENVTQAVAREVLAEAVLRVETKMFGEQTDPNVGLIGYVHDELIAQVPLDTKMTYAEFKRIMLQTPQWAKGLPISGEGYEAVRYRK